MRIAIGILTSAATMFIAGAFGLWGTWSLGAASIVGLVGAVWAVTVMEERDSSASIAMALTDRRRPVAGAIDELRSGSV